MGIDIYAYWQGQTARECEQRDTKVFSIDAGDVGYLREAYHGGPYGTRTLMPEVFGEEGRAFIPAKLLRERLAAVLEVVRERQRKIYELSDDAPEMAMACQSFADFVDLCERMEAKTVSLR